PGRDHQAQVLLLFEDLQRLIAVARGDDDLGEYLGNGASQVRTERVIDDDDAAERRLTVGRIREIPSGLECIRAGNTAGIGVLQDRDRRALEFADQVGR